MVRFTSTALPLPGPALSLDPLEDERQRRPKAWFWLLFGIAFLYTFLLALELLTQSFVLLAGPNLEVIIAATANPIVGVSAGILITAAIQSSSVVTSVLVAIVGAGTLTIAQAVPIVMGANMGTTFTACLVAISHITNKKEFRKGLAAGLVHNFFNIGATLLWLPLELRFGTLTQLSNLLARAAGLGFAAISGLPSLPLNKLVSPVAARLVHQGSSAWVWVGIGMLLLFCCIFLFRTFLKVIIIGDVERDLDQQVFSKPWRALASGTGLTALVHSSTITTSLCVPLAATNKVGVRKLLPFIVGANIGTTVTALIAAIGRSEAAVSLAFSHLLFNLVAGAIIFPIPPLKAAIVNAARSFARLCAKHRSLVLAYLLGFFFLLPVLVFLVAGRG